MIPDFFFTLIFNVIFFYLYGWAFISQSSLGSFVVQNSMDMLHLTNRFHVAMRAFSNRSQMTSKCDKNKTVAHEAIAECVTDVLTTFNFDVFIYIL